MEEPAGPLPTRVLAILDSLLRCESAAGFCYSPSSNIATYTRLSTTGNIVSVGEMSPAASIALLNFETCIHNGWSSASSRSSILYIRLWPEGKWCSCSFVIRALHIVFDCCRELPSIEFQELQTAPIHRVHHANRTAGQQMTATLPDYLTAGSSFRRVLPGGYFRFKIRELCSGQRSTAPVRRRA